jgi:hypothetical protein
MKKPNTNGKAIGLIIRHIDPIIPLIICLSGFIDRYNKIVDGRTRNNSVFAEFTHKYGTGIENKPIVNIVGVNKLFSLFSSIKALVNMKIIDINLTACTDQSPKNKAIL